MRAFVSSHKSGSRVSILLSSLFVVLAVVSLSSLAVTQDVAAVAAVPHPLITQTLDEGAVTALKGNTHPLARPEFDLGTAPASLPMQRMLLVLKRSPEQESALRKLMDDQQDKNSPNYHKWMTPEEFGAQFGPADSDMQTITSWLQSHGFQVASSKGRTVLEFSGSASQVQEAFHTTIHKYLVNGAQSWANASDPQIPTALAPAVAGVLSMNNFPRKSMSVVGGVFSRDKATGRIKPVQPNFTLPTGCVENNSSSTPCYYGVGPYDFATIYDVLPLWNAGINGTGQTIAIVGETNINIQDVADFRAMFGLPVNNPNIILNGPDPGIIGDEVEADIDVQWSGAVAPNATIDFVVSGSTESTAGIDLSAVYIIENNLAPVMSESYGYCELGLGTAGNQFYNALWQQAAAQGITVFISAGDNGSAGCDDFNAQPPSPARYGLQVSGFASTPYNIAVGGTDFNDYSNPATYWNINNGANTQVSAKSYIPEVPWNDSCANPIFGTVGFSTNAETNCNDSRLSSYVIPLGGSGGASNCTTPSGNTPANCAGGYTKPTWQSGKGVPTDGKRDIPDVSLFASNGFLQNFYISCTSDLTYGTCNLSSPYQYFLAVGGTSVSSPAFAGIMALVNQQTGSRQGNANYIFYKLATQQPTAFHDISTGTIAMPCLTGTTNCTTTTGGHSYGILSGYTAGANYDLATGLGSVDANNLVTKWNTVTLLPSTTTLTNVSPTTVTHGQSVSFTATVKPSSGTGTPSGLVSLEGSPANADEGIAAFNLTNGTVTSNTKMLTGGTYSLIAHYPGDSTYGPSDSTAVSVTVNKENSQPQAFLVTLDGNGNIVNSHTNTAQYGTEYWIHVDVENAAGQLCNPVATTGETGCPTGSVTLTNNGTPLTGSYTVNDFGYAEAQSVQLSGGADSLKATYSGDSSFNASSGTTPITITPAYTQTAVLGVSGAVTGQSATISAMVVPYTTLGAAPSGTITFYANGTALPGTVTYSTGGSAPQWLNASLNYTFATSGNYAITATYSGDNNYVTSDGGPQNITVKYPTPTVTANPYSQNVSYGGTATINVLIDTTNKTAYPTGTVTLSGLGNPVACTSTTDSSGNYACQANISFTVTTGGTIQVQYSGDANYPSAYNWAYISMPDFQMLGGGAQLNAGQSQNISIILNSLGNFNGTVSNFACSNLPAETTCAFSPSQVTLAANGSSSATLTVTTAALGQARRRAVNNGQTILGMLEMTLLGICFIGIPALGTRRRAPSLFMLILLLVLVPSCGGGGNGSGGGGTRNPVPSIQNLQPTGVAAGSQIQNLYINGSNFLASSTVSYNGSVHNSSLQSPTQLQIALSPTDVANVGQFPVVVTNPSPGGGASAPMNFAVETGTPTGVFSFTVTASSGAITHSQTYTLVVQ